MNNIPYEIWLIIFLGLIALTRVLLNCFIKSESRKMKILLGTGVWGIFTICGIMFLYYMMYLFFREAAFPQAAFNVAAVTILVWNIAWLFIAIMYSVIQGKKRLTQQQKMILKDM